MAEMLWRVSGGGRCKFETQGGLVLITADNCSSSNSRGNRTWVKGGSAWKCVPVCVCVCACVIQPARIPKLSPVLHKQPLNFLPNHTTVPPCTENSLCFWLPFDTSALLQFGKRGWTDLLSRAAFLSVFHLRDQQTSDEFFLFFFPLRNEKSASGNTCHALLKYKMNSNCGTF